MSTIGSFALAVVAFAGLYLLALWVAVLVMPAQWRGSIQALAGANVRPGVFKELFIVPVVMGTFLFAFTLVSAVLFAAAIEFALGVGFAPPDEWNLRHLPLLLILWASLVAGLSVQRAYDLWRENKRRTNLK